MPDTPARIRHIALVARDDVHVEVEHRLARRRCIVEADVVAVRGVLLVQGVLDGVDEFDDGCPLIGCG